MSKLTFRPLLDKSYPVISRQAVMRILRQSGALKCPR